ncbi:MAG TPA: hypothetical protein VEV81_12520, partial [Pyrinomonadaceae bacterium]|nr:hypothetical protein [Pyrinomonadaceae bacterium]
MPTCLRALATALCLMTPPALTLAQTTPGKAAPQKTTRPEKGARPDPVAIERRATVITLVTGLADEARGFRDEQLRARVQMRAADALWETDADKARDLFRRAWEAADSADREALRRAEESRRTQSGGGSSGGDRPNL